MRTAFRIVIPMAMLAVAACGGKQAGTGTPNPGTDEQAPDFTGGGQQGNGEVGDSLYPGPYGVGIGSVIPNYTFMGFPRSTQDRTTLVKIQLADFYNPTGTDVYPDGSPYGAGTPKPLALVLDRSAVWCGPCNMEARDVLPVKHEQFAPKGEFLLMLTDGAIRGNAPTQQELENWTGSYNLDYPGTIDPNSAIAAVVGVDAYPGNVIVRTRDMKIITWTAGEPGSDFWTLFQKVIDGQPVLQGDN